MDLKLHPKRRAKILGSFACFILLCTLLSLAHWQFQRARQKQAWLDAFYDAERQPAEPWHANQMKTPVVLRRVVVTGTPQPALTVFLDHQWLEHEPGYFVLTPMLPEHDSSTLLWLNRGFLPKTLASPDIHNLPTLPESITVEGYLREVQNIFYFSKANGQPDQNQVIQYVDWNALAAFAQMPSHPGVLFVQMIKNDIAKVDDLRHNWDPASGVVPQKHTAYAVQWLLMAVALCCLYGYTMFNARRVSDGD